jgi:hypothetical protein
LEEEEGGGRLEEEEASTIGCAVPGFAVVGARCQVGKFFFKYF